ncbi:unnamed protein product [Arabidopsis thaliana]|uniref:Uncharacterized protein n=2 Tax=Arabidopsis thaliana TaxID=3702 RepID=A0A654E999_ARATH|nr:uncharacterized protein AT1G13143 [Arabidopsis thaliana]ANM58621.1 hypothetical protein AT1G13143 [Arabidopsis thaliana]CAA0198061.1 unnamed protein product [Arabidopsis thaliana]VYS45923.1 unnamed protein product [Arabidopsis thaliana]|eukprot:NP_001321043.1 hypothetical protein AT1G13143 [Arabidopsis thaliana]
MSFSSLTVKRLSFLLVGESPRCLKISLISRMILFSTSGCFCITQKNHIRSTTILSTNSWTTSTAFLRPFSYPMSKNFRGFHMKGGIMNLNIVDSVASSKA